MFALIRPFPRCSSPQHPHGTRHSLPLLTALYESNQSRRALDEQRDNFHGDCPLKARICVRTYRRERTRSKWITCGQAANNPPNLWITLWIKPLTRVVEGVELSITYLLAIVRTLVFY